MSPLEVSIIIHACCRADELPNRGAPAVEEAVAGFARSGILIDLGRKVVATEDGRAWLAAICSVPRPTKGWFDATGTRLDHLMVGAALTQGAANEQR